MFFLLLFFVIGAVTFYLYSKYKKTPQSDPIPPGKFDLPEHEMFRIAVHEAGHAVAAWWCTAVGSVVKVTMDDPSGQYGGYVLYSFYYKHTKKSLWCNLTITLAGMAAEALIYKKVRSGTARKDLAHARQVVGEIIQAGWEEAPWDIQGQSSLAFNNMFEIPLTEQENKILLHAFQYAKEFVWNRIKNHHLLVVLLLKHRTLNEDQLFDLFGDREFSFGAKFIRT